MPLGYDSKLALLLMKRSKFILEALQPFDDFKAEICMIGCPHNHSEMKRLVIASLRADTSRTYLDR